MFAYNTYKHTRITIKKIAIILPNPPLPEGLLGIFQGGLLLMLSHPSLETSKRCSKPQPTHKLRASWI